MAVADIDLWLDAQSGLLGAALLDSELVPRIVADLTAEDFTGYNRPVFEAMASAFRESRKNSDVDPVAVLTRLGNSDEHRKLLASMMQAAAVPESVERYVQQIREASKLSRMRELAQSIATAADLETATEDAGKIGELLIDHPGVKAYSPDDLLAEFFADVGKDAQRLPLPFGMDELLHIFAGNLIAIGAEPSAGKTAFALQLMAALARDKRVLFVSLETDQKMLFKRLACHMAGIPMDAMMRGKLDDRQMEAMTEVSMLIHERSFRILPAAGIGIAGIKAAAVSYRAGIIIVDYMGLINMPGYKDRYTKVTEISMQLHTLAMSTGMIVFALSQVTNRSPDQKNKPLDIHSLRESGQIEADCDVILMIDKFIDKELKDTGCKANRILRCVKNKNGRLFRMPMILDGSVQTFRKAPVPNADWEKLQADKKTKQTAKKAAESKQDPREYGQLPMDTYTPFT